MAISKLRRTSSQRKALLRDLVTDLIINERIVTTHSKALELKRSFEKMVTLAKKGDLSARRLAAETVRNEMAAEGQTALQKLFSDLAPRFKERQGGYTRIIKMEARRGDNAPMSIIELV